MTSPGDDAIREHYRDASDVYAALARVDGNETIAAPDNVAWYRTSDHGDIEALDDGYDRQARPVRLGTDLEYALNETDRVFYAITSYKDPVTLNRSAYYRYENGSMAWYDDNPLPEVGDIRAFAIWGDVDLVDELKKERSDLDADTVATFEAILNAYINAFAELIGTRDAVYALDSVGGAYLFTAPEATLPIAEFFADDPDALTRVMGALRDRSNDHFEAVQKRVEDEIDGATEVCDPDWVNNKNRQYKAPLSLHKSHDAVVTPLDTRDVEYRVTAFDDVTDEHFEAAEEWADEFTAVEHTDCVASLVESLWPDYCDEHDSWRDALDAWVADERESETVNEFNGDGEEHSPAVEGAPITTNIQAVYDAVAEIPIADVAEQTVVHQWTANASGLTDNSGANNRAFVPVWGPNAKTGNANYVDTCKNVWNDSGNGHHGTVVELALIAREGWTRGKIAQGADWHRGVAQLRDMGYDIPVFTPDADTVQDSDEMPFWAVKEAAVALGVLPREAFTEQETDDGETYLGFPGQNTYETALKEIEKAGLRHGRRTKTQRLAKNRLKTILGQQEEADDEGLSTDEKQTVAQSVGELTDKDYDEFAADVAEMLGRTRRSLDRHRSLYHQQQNDHVFVENHKVKRVTTTNSGWRVTDVLLDFDLDVQRFVQSPDPNGPTMADVHVIPSQSPGTEYTKTVEPDVFNEPRKFKSNVMDQVFGTTIPVDRSERDVINEVRKWIDRQDVPWVKGQKEIGLNADYDEFVLPGGTLTGDGWTDEPGTVYVDQDWAVADRVELTPREYNEFDADEVAEMIELLVNTRVPERGLPVWAWFYATPYHRRIMDVAGQFNPINVTATSGAGKTAALGALNVMFGMDGRPNDLTDTRWAFSTKFLASRGVPIWFDEYKRTELTERQVDRLNRHLKIAARGGMMERGNQDRSTDGVRLMSPLVLSGEDHLDGSAVERRAIMVTMLESAKEEGSATRAAFMELVGSDFVGEDGEIQVGESDRPLPEHALAYYRFVAATSDDEFESDWMESKRYVARRLDEWGHSSELGDMETQGLETIVFGYLRLRAFAESVDADMDAIPGWGDVDDALQHVAQVGEDKRLDDKDRYVELLSRATVNGELEAETHWTVVKAGKSDEELRVNLNRAHDKVTKFVGDHRSDADMLSQADDYRKHFKEACERGDSYVVSYSQPTTGLNRCIGIDMHRAEEEIPGFERSVFVSEDGDASSELTSADGDDDDDSPGDPVTENHVPVNRVDEALDNGTGYVDVTVKATNWRVGPENSGIAELGTVQDVTGTVDVVDFFGSITLEEDEHYLIKQAQVDTYNGRVQLVIREGTTTAEPIQPGVGYTEGADPAGNKQLGDAAAEATVEAAATDGGKSTEIAAGDGEVVQKSKIVLDIIRERTNGDDHPEHCEVQDEAADRYDLTSDEVDSAIDSLLMKGDVYEPEPGVIRAI